MSVATAEVHRVPRDGRGARDADLILDVGIVAGLEFPDDGADVPVERVKISLGDS